MPPIEIGPQGPQAPRAVRAVEPHAARASSAGASRPAQAGAEPNVVRSDALDPGPEPVDAERVAVIRKAIEQGNYPVIPMRVADAMIAAGLLLRSGK